MDASKNIHVLVVDDEDRFRKTVTATLRKKGFHVAAVDGGWDAIREMCRDDYDVVVLDVKMPVMDGHKVLREIKAIQPSVQVIMLTGHGSMDSALESWRDEAFTYLTKPCDIDALANMIECAYGLKENLIDSHAPPPDSLKSESGPSASLRRLFRNKNRPRLTRLKGGR